MADNLKEVIAKLKARQTSPQSNPVSQDIPVPRPIGRPPKVQENPISQVKEIADEDEFDEEVDILPEPEAKAPVMPQETPPEAVPEQISREQQILMEIEMLQNNGRYRAEMLHQLQEINRALVVIAKVLADLTDGKS